MLNPYYITGLIEGEGWFGVSIAVLSGRKMNAGAQVSLNFGINMNGRELELIQRIKCYFDCGTLEIRNNGMVQYRVRSFRDVKDKIIPFFDIYELQGGKKKDFEMFKIIATLMEEKKHLTVEGLNDIKNIRKNMHVYGFLKEE